MRQAADLSPTDLASVNGGAGILRPATVKMLEAGAKKFAQKALGGGGHDLYAGTDINGSNAKGIILHGPNRGVLVSTGDDPTGHAPQFYVGRVLMKKLGQFVGLKDL